VAETVRAAAALVRRRRLAAHDAHSLTHSLLAHSRSSPLHRVAAVEQSVRRTAQRALRAPACSRVGILARRQALLKRQSDARDLESVSRLRRTADAHSFSESTSLVNSCTTD
jgi:hypothetical protein